MNDYTSRLKIRKLKTQYQHSHCFPSPQPLSSPSTTPGNNNRCCTIMQQQQTNNELGKPPFQNIITPPTLPIRNNNHHSSIIGYTRVPFFTFSPASSIVPVKQTQSSNINRGAFTCLSHPSPKQLHNTNNNSIDKNEDRLCQRIFKRDQSHGMMELVQEHNKNKNHRHPRPVSLAHQHQENDKCCNIALSIDISGQKPSSFLPTTTTTNNNVNLSALIDSISQMADLYAVQFENILYLLEQLQRYGGNQKFKALLKKEDQTIWIYFPRTLFPENETPTIKHAYHWLSQVLAIDVDDHNNWEIIDTSSGFIDQKEELENGGFDGANYFRDIHMFLDHVDQMMESNNLFGASSSSGKGTPSRI
ncbi:hypothetical protein K501DRAFT_329463 [Backusella circina FSU 941]|nr:hypothetical protein K501DRAFT_329463 [Backusella circina FSU 941]